MKKITIYSISIMFFLCLFISGRSFAGTLPAPTLESPANEQTGVQLTPALEWSDVLGAISYRVQVASDISFKNVLVDDESNTSSYIIPDNILSNSTQYYWRAAATDFLIVTGEWSEPFTFTTYTLPQLGINLPVSLMQGSDWQNFKTTIVNPADGIGYKSASVDFALLASSPLSQGDIELQYQDEQNKWVDITLNETKGGLTGSLITPSLLPDMTESTQLRIRAASDAPVDTYNTFANLVSDSQILDDFSGAFTVIIPPPEAPVLVSPPHNSTGVALNVTFDWNDVANADSYTLQVSENSQFKTTVISQANIKGSEYTAPKGALNNSTQYYWRVSAGNTTGEGNYSSVFGFTTIAGVPAPPQLVSPKDGAQNMPLTFTLNWSGIKGVDSYGVQVSPDSTFSTSLINESGVTGTSYLIDAKILNNSTTYYWRVNATNKGGTSEYSEPFSFTTIVADPTVPELVSPKDGATGQPLTVTLDWNDVVNAKGYDLEVAEDISFSSPLISANNLKGTEYEVQSGILSNSTVYYWRVRAENFGGTSEYSEPFSFTTIVADPTVPVLVSPLNGATGQPLTVTLDWNDVVNAKGYDLEVDEDTSFSSPVISQSGLTETQYTVLPGVLSNGTVYYWRVRAENNGGTSEYSAPFSFRTILSSPIVPILSTPVNGAKNVSVNPSFDWQDVAEASAYNLEVANDSAFTEIVINAKGLTASEYTAVDTLNGNSIYYWRVNAENKGGTGEYSSVFSFTTEAVQPPAPFLQSPSNGQKNVSVTPTLDWQDVVEDNLQPVYEVEVASDENFENLVVTKTGVSESQYEVEFPLDPLTQYFWRVRYSSENGTSEWSVAWSFTTTTITGLSPISGEIPKDYELNQNYPNPFNPTTKIRFGIPQVTGGAHNASVVVYNMLGQVMATLYNGQISSGVYEVQFNASSFSSGTYFYELRTDNFRSIKRMTLIK